MKPNPFLPFLLFLPFLASAQDWTRMGFIYKNPPPSAYDYTPPIPDPPKNEWRLMDGKPVKISFDWRYVSGHVLQPFKTGEYLVSIYRYSDHSDAKTILIKNFPFKKVDNEKFPSIWVKETGIQSYHTAIGATATVRVYDYGAPCDPPAPPPPDPRLLAAKLAREQENKAQLPAKILAYHQAEAARGTLYGLLEMGKRYAAGDGVKKDPSKAREYFQRAAAQGSPDATNLLQKLNL